MKKFFEVFVLLSAMVFLVSCGSSSSSDNNSAANMGKLGKECYPNETCDKGLRCDTDNNVCVEDPENPINDSDRTDSGSDGEADHGSDSDGGDSAHDSSDSEPDDTDTAHDGGDTTPDNGDSTPDEGDSVPDNGDTTPDEEDPVPDDDTDTADLNPETLTLGNICTGQTLCYNNEEEITCPSSSSADFYGQDAQYQSKCTPQSFTVKTVSGNKVVVDNNTGLVWEQSPSEETYTWANRNSHCNELNRSNYGGKSNWRVPNPLEFLTIVDNSTYNPATNSNFAGMPTENSTYLWTNNEYKSATIYGYAYYFCQSFGGYWYNVTTTTTYKVLCVSGNELVPATSSDFLTSSDGKVITDTRTGLMWQKEYGTSKTWQQALSYCQSLNAEGYGGYSSGWRLPNKNELASLLDPGKSREPYSNFPDMPSHWFWSSSTGVDITNRAWYVRFNDGYVWVLDKTEGYGGYSYNFYVRCVR